MNKKEIFRKIGGIITDLNEQYQYLSQNPESLNEPELELFTANAHFLSDHIAILKKLNDHASKVAPLLPVKAIDVEQEPEELERITEHKGEAVEKIQEPEWKFEIEKEPEIKFELEQEDNQPDDQNVIIKEADSLDNTVQHEAQKMSNDISSEVQKSEAILEAEPFIKEVVLSEKTIVIPVEKPTNAVNSEIPTQTINDLLKTSQTTIAGNYSQQPIKDLKSVINLNDKLLFVKDLFNGYSLAYSEAIELLNRCNSMEAADNLLKLNYAAKNRWSDKQATVDQFYEILNRRFSK